MLIPIGHDQQIRRLPWMTFGIIAVCTLVQIYASQFAPSDDDVMRLLSALDTATGDSADALAKQLQDILDKIPMLRFGYQTGSDINSHLLTSAFVHAGWLHLIGNMLFLWLAGSVLEDRWGRIKFLLFYLCGAAASTLCFDALYHGERTILVGASGAISATMGAFLVYHGRAQIRFWYWWMMRTGTFQLAAYFALPLWLGEQVLWTVLEPHQGVSGTAYSAHVGGFMFGLVVAFVLGKVIGSRDESTDDDAPIPTATAHALPPDPAREATCMDAIRRGDADAVRMLASRLILELSRAGKHARVIELYEAITASFPTAMLTEAAFVATATAAEAKGDNDRYVAIANAFMREQPESQLLPRVMWRLAHFHRLAGRGDLATSTMEALVQRFPDDPVAVQAKAMLGQRQR